MGDSIESQDRGAFPGGLKRCARPAEDASTCELQGVVVSRREMMSEQERVAALLRIAVLRQEIEQLSRTAGLDTGTAVLSRPIDGPLAWSLVSELFPDLVSVHSSEGEYLFVSDNAVEFYGWRPEELLGRHAYELIHPDDLPKIALDHARHASHGRGTIRYRIRRADGSYFWVETRSRSLRSSSGVVSIVALTHDVDQEHVNAQLLARAEERLRLTLAQAPVGMAIVSIDGQWLEVNDALCAILGYTHTELLARTFHDVTHPDDLDADLSLVHQLLAGVRSDYRMEKRYFRRDGSICEAVLSVALARDEDGKALHFISQIEDVTERNRMQSELLSLAQTDQLTGLLVRRAGQAALEREIDRSRRHDIPLAVILLDIDNFKRVNDTWGHAAGDAVLRAIGHTIKTQRRSGDVATRWGGEEILIATPHAGPADALKVAERYRRAFAALHIETVGNVTVSAGVAALERSDTLERMLERADRALYEAKRAGRNRVAR